MSKTKERLEYATDTGRIPLNPARMLKSKHLPSVKRMRDAEEERYALTAAEVAVILAHLPSPYDLYARVRALTGMRPEEARGLTVGDVDLDMGTLTVRAVVVDVNGHAVREDETKTKGSRRTVALDADTLARLRAYVPKHTKAARAAWPAEVRRVDRLRTKAERAGRVPPEPLGPFPGNELPLFVGLRTGRAFGKADAARLDYSKPLADAVFRKRYWRPALSAAGVPATVRPYDLRHFHASSLVGRLGAEGALTLKEIQNRLGHASAAMTLDRYARTPRADYDRQRSALDAVVLSDATPDNVTELRPKGTLSG